MAVGVDEHAVEAHLKPVPAVGFDFTLPEHLRNDAEDSARIEFESTVTNDVNIDISEFHKPPPETGW